MKFEFEVNVNNNNNQYCRINLCDLIQWLELIGNTLKNSSKGRWSCFWSAAVFHVDKSNQKSENECTEFTIKPQNEFDIDLSFDSWLPAC